MPHLSTEASHSAPEPDRAARRRHRVLFRANVRYGYNLAVSLFGGTTPLVITALMDTFDKNVMVPAYYTMGAALVGVIAVACMKETAQQPLEGSPPAVSTKEEALELIASQTPEPRF